MERLMTKQEEEVIRWVHHDFAGKTVSQTAKIMGLSASRIYQLLTGVKKRAPQLFPILTQKEAVTVKLLLEKSLTLKEISTVFGEPSVHTRSRLQRIKEKGFVIPDIAKPIRYTPEHDGHIREKF